MSYKCLALLLAIKLYRHLSFVISLKAAETRLVDIEKQRIKLGDYSYRKLYLKVV